MQAVEDRLAWVDTLRGLAVLSVFLLHVTLDVQRHAEALGTVVFGLDGLRAITFGILDFGKIGVANFFVVSGFLIPVTLDKTMPSVIRNFTINRFFRLYPAYWISIVLLLVFIPTTLTSPQVVANFTMLQRFVGIPDLNGVYWTLQIEIIFYVACAFLKWRGWLNRTNFVEILIIGMGLLALLLATLRYFSGIRMPVAVALALQLMFFGYLYRIWLFGGGVTAAKIRRALICIVLTLCISCPLAYSRDYGFGEDWGRYLISYIVAIGIFILVSKLRYRFAILSFLGRISYSFYLIHTIVVSVVVGLLLSSDRAVPSGIALIMILLASLLISTLVSWALYLGVEEPGIRMGRRMNAWLNTGRTPAIEKY